MKKNKIFLVLICFIGLTSLQSFNHTSIDNNENINSDTAMQQETESLRYERGGFAYSAYRCSGRRRLRLITFERAVSSGALSWRAIYTGRCINIE